MVENADNQEDQELIFEIDEKGSSMLVRSIEANQRAYLRFTNRTYRPLNVWWRDYRGRKQFYARVEPGRSHDINSYITHPWEFTDSDTKEHYVANSKIIFRPPPNVGGMQYRTNWNVTLPGVRTLRRSALLTLAQVLPNEFSVQELGLPRMLATELQELIASLRRPPAAVQV